MALEAPLRPEWCSLGPQIPCWFRLKLQAFDPDLVLQFIPSWDQLPAHERRLGMNPALCPQGAWHIFRSSRPGWVYKLAVFSLVDRVGNYVEPTPEVIKLLRYCRARWRRDESRIMNEMVENSIDSMKRDRVRQSRENLRQRFDDILVAMGKRQFQHRIAVPGGKFS